ncbi:MAG: hypothetical protein R3C53_20760 [Pirellulaceae bacterium]
MDATTAEWIQLQIKRLSAQPLIGYAPGEPLAAEAVAFSALVSVAYEQRAAAEAAGRRLLAAQNPNGSVAVYLNDEGPTWTTSLACLAWQRLGMAWPELAPMFDDARQRGIDFLLSFGGEKLEPSENVGHNTQLVGWPWVQSTHSWLEPTAFALLALRHCGYATHPRALEAAELIRDRFLPGGGTNYGNTTVLGQVLRPHVLPSAVCMVALHRSRPVFDRAAMTVRYLTSEIQHPLAAISAAWAVHALVSNTWEVPPAQLDELSAPWLQLLKTAITRSEVTGQHPHRANLLLLALRLRQSPILDLPEWPLHIENAPQS